MNYEEKSDYEIECLVECALDEQVAMMEFNHETGYFSWCAPDGEGGGAFRAAAYCSDVSLAWPIILENEIKIDPRRTLKKLPWMAMGDCEVYAVDENPLRAAMIVFLKMKEAEKCA